MNKQEQSTELYPVLPEVFYSKEFDRETLDIEITEDETILFRCDSPEDYVTFEMSKEDAIKLAKTIILNCG